MKLRRALVTAAATAAIAPLALLSAPAAFATAAATSAGNSSVSDTETTDTQTSDTETAGTKTPGTETGGSKDDEDATPSATASVTGTPDGGPSSTGSGSPSTTPTAPAPGGTGDGDGSASPSASTTVTPPASESPSASPSDEPSGEPSEEPEDCADSKVDASFSGLPGKIVKGSGWHSFTLNFTNNSKSTLTELDFFAGVASDEDGQKLFSSKQVALQAKDPDSGSWEAVELDGQSVDYLGYAAKLSPGYEIDIPLRLNVTSAAPVGAGFSLGAGVYADADDKCVGAGEASYKFRIVAPGTPTEGTKPQQGGSIPLPTQKPAAGSVPQVTGSLAETGSSSTLPVIALAGGIAIVAGAGVVFALRRRGGEDGAAA